MTPALPCPSHCVSPGSAPLLAWDPAWLSPSLIFHTGSPWDHGVMPPESPPPPPRSHSRHLHPRILCPRSPKLTPRIYTGLLPRIFSQMAPRHCPGGGGPSSSWGGQRSDMGLEFHTCAHNTLTVQGRAGRGGEGAGKNLVQKAGKMFH